MIYLTSYIFSKMVNQFEAEIYSNYFNVEVKDLKRISPLRIKRLIYSEEGKKLEEEVEILIIEWYEGLSERLERGEIPQKDLRILKNSYKFWGDQEKLGIYKIIDEKSGKKFTPFQESLREVFKEANYTEKYDKYFDVTETKFKNKLKIYEYKNEVYIYLRYCDLNYHNVDHIFKRGALIYALGSIFYKKEINKHDYRWGSKDWVKEEIKSNGYNIDDTEFYHKKISCYLHFYLPQSAEEGLFYPEINRLMGNIILSESEYQDAYNLDLEELKKNNLLEEKLVWCEQTEYKFARNLLNENQHKVIVNNFEVWERLGRRDIELFIDTYLDAAHGFFEDLYDYLHSESFTHDYDEDFKVKKKEWVSEMYIYEFENVITLHQKWFITDYYNDVHLGYRGKNEGDSLIYKTSRISENGKIWGSRQWVKDILTKNSANLKKFEGKVINAVLLITFAQSGEQELVSTCNLPCVGNIGYEDLVSD